MDWNLSWIFWGGAAFALVLVNLIRTLAEKRNGWQVLLFASLSCGVMTVLKEYQMVAQWLTWGDMAAVHDVVPAMARTLRVSVAAGLLLNLAVLALNLRKERKQAGRNAEESKIF